MTYKLSVIGYPIGNSLSPLIHTSLLEYLGLSYEYEKNKVKVGKLPEFIEYAKEKGLSGFNITMPHKQTIMEYLDEIDSEALLFNSVNTVKIKDGRLIGYNTDAEGFKMSLPRYGEEIKDADIVIIGAGGASGAVALKTALSGARQINIINKSYDKAETLCKNIADKTKVSAKAFSFTYDSLNELCANADIIINATPLGMTGIDANFESLNFLEKAPENSLIYDLIYNPYETEFLKKGRLLNLKTVNGLGMLICQGLIADKIFLDMDFDIRTVQKIIEEKYKKI